MLGPGIHGNPISRFNATAHQQAQQTAGFVRRLFAKLQHGHSVHALRGSSQLLGETKDHMNMRILTHVLAGVPPRLWPF